MNNNLNTKKISFLVFICSFLIFLANKNGFSQVSQPNYLKSFTAEKINDKVKLKWSVGTELNIEKYTIERSVNGIDFNAIILRNSNGNSGSNATYSEFDNDPLPESSFYRINSLDNNGDTAFSKVLGFNNSYLVEELPIFDMYPNPYINGELTVEFVALLSEEARIIVSDLNGKTIHQSLIASNLITMQLDLSQGIYFVSVLTKSDRLTQKLVVD